MPPPITPEKERMVLSAWTQGRTEREAAAYAGVSLGGAHGVIQKAQKRIHDLTELRLFYEDLKRRDLSPSDLEHVISVQQRLDALNLTLDQVSSAMDFIEGTGYGEQTLQYVDAGMELRRLEAEYRIGFRDLVKWYEPTASTIGELQQKISQLSSQRDQLQTELPEIEKLKAMKDLLQARGVTLLKLEEFLDIHNTLEDLGFKGQVAKILASELSKTGFSPERAAAKVTQLLREAGSLEAAIYNLQATRNDFAIKTTYQEQKSAQLRKDIEEKQQAIRRLDAEVQTKIQEQEEVVDSAHEEARREYEQGKKQMESELRSLSAKIKNKEEELHDLEEKASDLRDRIVLGDTLIQVIRDPTSTTINQLTTLANSVNKTVEYREKYPAMYASDAPKVKATVIQILNEYVKRDIVYAGYHRSALAERDELKKELDAYVIALDEKKQIINGLSERLKPLEAALGPEAARQIIADFSGLSKHDVDGVVALLKQSAREISGERQQLILLPSKEIIEWVAKRIQSKRSNEQG